MDWRNTGFDPCREDPCIYEMRQSGQLDVFSNSRNEFPAATVSLRKVSDKCK